MSFSLDILRLDSSRTDFSASLEKRLARAHRDDPSADEVQLRVIEILRAVRTEKDSAVLRYTALYEHVDVSDIKALRIPDEVLQESLENISPAQREALETAVRRIRVYHEKQKKEQGGTWEYEDPLGLVLGQRVRPLDRVGIYVPGGQAAYPSSVLMNAIPAQVAGVSELVMVCPMPNGIRNPLLMAAAAILGIPEVYAIGGAQAIAALTYGTPSIRPVDKIVGPGNRYVAMAKQLVYGQVGIDMIAGPSEILVISDGSAPPEWVAMDLFSQAEHDADAQAILLCPSADYLDRVAGAMENLGGGLSRAAIIQASINQRGFFVKTKDLAEACRIANDIAPEHLELSVADPEALLPQIRHAGAIFMGIYANEALGDYCAGPNHVLPTSGTARFSSPLSVADFQKKSSIIRADKGGAAQLGRVVEILAKGEGLDAHAMSASLRIPSA